MKFLNRFIRPAAWHNLRTLKPRSRVFGFDRGTPIDRYYIEKFISENSQYIKGRVLEIGESTYTTQFGSGVVTKEVLHYTTDNPAATIIGDLTKIETLPEGQMDCFICTQTFNFIYDFRAAIRGAHQVLKKDGVLLATLAGLCQISRYDMDRWGDYWRFTTRSAEEAVAEVFGKENVKIQSFGNVLAAVSLLHGISADELSRHELNYIDPDYQIVITIVAKKC